MNGDYGRLPERCPKQPFIWRSATGQEGGGLS